MPAEGLLSLGTLEREAQKRLPAHTFDFFQGGSENEITLQRNLSSFSQLFLRPRVLTAVGTPSLGKGVLEHSLSMPCFVSPTAFHKLAHPSGEIASARAAAKHGVCFISSMASTTPIEEVTEAYRTESGVCTVWQQFYLQTDKQFNANFIARAEQAGCQALVVSVDSAAFGLRERDLKNNFLDLPEGLSCPNMQMENEPMPRSIEFNPNLGWHDIAELKQQTKLPIVLKGILHPADALLAVEAGASAIIVSNQGGRQLDTCAPSIFALPEIVKAVGDRIPVLMDGGIRRGTDAIKALALGASAVGLGRSVLWGLSIGGESGVNRVFDLFREELERSLKLCGVKSVEQIDSNLIFSREGKQWF